MAKIVVDADGKVVLGCGLTEVVINAFDHRWCKFFGG